MSKQRQVRHVAMLHIHRFHVRSWLHASCCSLSHVALASHVDYDAVESHDAHHSRMSHVCCLHCANVPWVDSDWVACAVEILTLIKCKATTSAGMSNGTPQGDGEACRSLITLILDVIDKVAFEANECLFKFRICFRSSIRLPTTMCS
jgi:hypothetical protein